MSLHDTSPPGAHSSRDADPAVSTSTTALNLTTPAGFLQTAIQAVPAIRWAIGVGGIIAVITLARAWRIEPLFAVLGTGVMLVLMTALVLFAHVSTTSPEVFRLPIAVFIWAALILTVATASLLFTAVFFHWPPLDFLVRQSGYRASAGDERIWTLQDNVNQLRGTWGSLTQYGEVKRHEVLDRAPKLGQQLLDVDDKTLGLGGRVVKREYACYAFIMAADTEPDKDRTATFSKQALDLCHQASSLLQSIVAKHDSDASTQAVYDWAQDNDQQAFTDYLSGMAMCLHGIATSDAQATSDAVAFIHRTVPDAYLDTYPPEHDSILTRCIPGGVK